MTAKTHVYFIDSWGRPHVTCDADHPDALAFGPGAGVSRMVTDNEVAGLVRVENDDGWTYLVGTDVAAAAASKEWTMDRINARQYEMWSTLEDCDCCCGGGDEEMAFLDTLKAILPAEA
jgi:hypothetical protein